MGHGSSPFLRQNAKPLRSWQINLQSGCPVVSRPPGVFQDTVYSAGITVMSLCAQQLKVRIAQVNCITRAVLMLLEGESGLPCWLLWVRVSTLAQWGSRGQAWRLLKQLGINPTNPQNCLSLLVMF